MEKIARGHGREANIARGEAECCISLETKPECHFFPYCTHGSALTGLFSVLAGLFEQIAKVLLGAIE